MRAGAISSTPSRAPISGRRRPASFSTSTSPTVPPAPIRSGGPVRCRRPETACRARSRPENAAESPSGRRIGSPASDDAGANEGHRHLGQDDDGEDGRKDDGDLVPVEEVESGIEGHSDPAGPVEAEDRRFADVDIPAEQRDRPEGGPRLRPIAKNDGGQLRRARRRQRLDRAAVASSNASARSLPVKPIERK